jgi:hypothetical protein
VASARARSVAPAQHHVTGVSSSAANFLDSCKPNLFARPVYTCDQDDRIPRIAFFALEDIPAGRPTFLARASRTLPSLGTELTVDYHLNKTLDDSRRFTATTSSTASKCSFSTPKISIEIELCMVLNFWT